MPNNIFSSFLTGELNGNITAFRLKGGYDGYSQMSISPILSANIVPKHIFLI